MATKRSKGGIKRHGKGRTDLTEGEEVASPHGWETIDHEEGPSQNYPSSSSSYTDNPLEAPWWRQWWPWGELVEGVWAALAVALGVWSVVASAVLGQGGAVACKGIMHAAGRASFDLICRRPAAADGVHRLLEAASSRLPTFVKEWVHDHAGHHATTAPCPLTHLVQEPSPSAVWIVVLGLMALVLLHFRFGLRSTVFRTPSRCALVLFSCVAASLVLLRFLLSVDFAFRDDACSTLLSSTSLEFSCTDDSLAETIGHLRGVLPIPEWRDVARAASEHMLGRWVMGAVQVLSPGFKYVGLCLGALLLLLPDLAKHNAQAVILRYLRRPIGKVVTASVIGGAGLVLWLPQFERAGNAVMVVVGYWALSCSLCYLFLQAVWSHLFRIAFFALAPAYIVGGVILFHKALAFLAHETCGAAIPVALILSLALFYAHRWDCTKAVGAYVLWKSLSYFSVPLSSLPTFFYFAYWWTSSLFTTALSATSYLLQAAAGSSSSSSSSSSPSPSSSSAQHLATPWATLDALVMIYFAGMAVTALASALASLTLFFARRHLGATPQASKSE